MEISGFRIRAGGRSSCKVKRSSPGKRRRREVAPQGDHAGTIQQDQRRP